jgi:hypothetical protein
MAMRYWIVKNRYHEIIGCYTGDKPRGPIVVEVSKEVYLDILQTTYSAGNNESDGNLEPA